jgi:hypothetical protein
MGRLCAKSPTRRRLESANASPRLDHGPNSPRPRHANTDKPPPSGASRRRRRRPRRCRRLAAKGLIYASGHRALGANSTTPPPNGSKHVTGEPTSHPNIWRPATSDSGSRPHPRPWSRTRARARTRAGSRTGSPSRPSPHPRPRTNRSTLLHPPPSNTNTTTAPYPPRTRPIGSTRSILNEWPSSTPAPTGF